MISIALPATSLHRWDRCASRLIGSKFGVRGGIVILGRHACLIQAAPGPALGGVGGQVRHSPRVDFIHRGYFMMARRRDNAIREEDTVSHDKIKAAARVR